MASPLSIYLSICSSCICNMNLPFSLPSLPLCLSLSLSVSFSQCRFSIFFFPYRYARTRFRRWNWDPYFSFYEDEWRECGSGGGFLIDGKGKGRGKWEVWGLAWGFLGWVCAGIRLYEYRGVVVVVVVDWVGRGLREGRYFLWAFCGGGG